MIENTLPKQPTRLYSEERRELNRLFSEDPILNGNDREGSFGRALNRINEHLRSHGFEIDMVTADLLLGAGGSRLLTFRRSNHTEDPFYENPEIENAHVTFSWECMNHQQPQVRDASRLETLAYIG